MYTFINQLVKCRLSLLNVLTADTIVAFLLPLVCTDFIEIYIFFFLYTSFIDLSSRVEHIFPGYLICKTRLFSP